MMHHCICILRNSSISIQRSHTHITHCLAADPSVRPLGCCGVNQRVKPRDALPLTPATEMKRARARKGRERERRAAAERHTHLRPAPYGRAWTRPLLLAGGVINWLWEFIRKSLKLRNHQSISSYYKDTPGAGFTNKRILFLTLTKNNTAIVLFYA